MSLDVAALRALFPVTRRLTYLDHAAVAPLPTVACDGVRGYLDELSTQGAVGYPATPARLLGRARSLGARLMHTTPEQVFVVRSTSQGIAVAAAGLDVSPGDNVVLVEREFPASTRPWVPLRARGVELRLVPQVLGRVDYAALEAAIDRRTAAVCVSFVQFLSGFRLDVGRVAGLCRRHDALFVLDAIQGLGVLPLEVEAAGVDLVSADAHKWMLGPEGVGLGYASPRALERLQPAVQGWLSVQDPWALFDLEQPLKASAARFEEGAANMAGLAGMNESLELLLGLGTEAIEARLLELTSALAEGLEHRGWERVSPFDGPHERSGILSVRKEGVALEALRARLLSEGVVLSARAGALRLSPHVHTDATDLARLFAALDAA